MKSLLILFLTFFTIWCSSSASAQDRNSYNLNVNSGLPSNHIYGMITDRLGYLWICTDKGVVRYNGYECRLFTIADGLPTDDIWELMDDASGRIWLGCISDEIGYLKNGRYHKAQIDLQKRTFYPKSLRRFGNSIVFGLETAGSAGLSSFCFERNDSIITDQFKDIPSISQKIPAFDSSEIISIMDELGRPVVIASGKIISIPPTDTGYRNDPGVKRMVGYSTLSNPEIFHKPGLTHLLFGNYILSVGHIREVSSFFLTNIYTGVTRQSNLDLGVGENILYPYPEKKPITGNFFYLFTNHNILKCKVDTAIKILEKFPVADFVKDLGGGDLNTFHCSDFWRVCVGTFNRGVWLKHPNKFISERKNINLSGYKCVGRYKDTCSFWWNKAESKFAVVDCNNTVTYVAARYQKSADKVNNIKSVTHYSGDTFLVSSALSAFFCLKTGVFQSVNAAEMGYTQYAAIVKDRNEISIVSLYGYFRLIRQGKYLEQKIVSKERYNGMRVDSLAGRYWIFNNNNILLQDIQTRDTSYIHKAALQNMGVNGLQEIKIDNKYGNVFLKGYDNIVAFDPKSKRSKNLFENLHLTDAVSIFIVGDKLVVVWKYGVLFSKINGLLDVSEPMWYMNPKSIVYSEIYGSEVLNNRVQLNTDNGFYSMQIPSDHEIAENRLPIPNEYRFIANYADISRIIVDGDSLNLMQKDKRVLLDIINANANGKVKFFYAFGNSKFEELNANEINLPDFYQPDDHINLSLYAVDDSWRSKAIVLNLYLVPEWWQTHLVVRLIWTGIAFMVLIVIIVSVLLTRRVVLRRAEQKHLRMEMELKSIYAQLNPHFIFNSLNSALLLVSKNRMDEAYSHISKFSRLLRAYLKSSRNKFITIAEELENLRNYIELQQTRFKDKFAYQLMVNIEDDLQNIKIPSLLIQPFVENAINHGILHLNGSGKLSVEFRIYSAEKKVVCVIEDNGIGRARAKIINESIEPRRESYGNLMIRDLINIFNKHENTRIDVTYTDKALPETGTIVTITIMN